MPSGWTTTSTLADSLPDIIANARIVREFAGVMPQIVDRFTLDSNTGLDWNEVAYQQITALAETETTELDNPQQLADTIFSVTPTKVAVHVLITDRVKARISANGLQYLGDPAQLAIQRKKDEDGLTTLDTLSTSLGGAGTTGTTGHISAATSRIQGNTTEPGEPPFYTVAHPFQLKDLQDEVVAGVGTYPLGPGVTEQTLRDGYRGPLFEAALYADGNITIDSSDDAKGGIFSKRCIVLIQGEMPKAIALRNEKRGGGSDELIVRDEYAYGIRTQNWGFEWYTDATAPTG